MSIRIALAGNPNSGKTTLFNALTGSNQYVGNWPGVTVEKKEGRLKSDRQVKIGDTPGIYSLSPYTLEEVVARNYLLQERPEVILNIIDGTNIERNLYLTTQLMELGIPVILAVNMMDAVEKNGDTIDMKKLGDAFGTVAVPISALKGTGIQKAAQLAMETAKKHKVYHCRHHFSEPVEAAIEQVEGAIGTAVPEEQKRFFAIKLLENDEKIREEYAGLPDVSEEIETLEKAFDDDVESIIANERYQVVSDVIDGCLTRRNKEKLTVSDRIDRVVTNRIAALPIFAGIMILVYVLSVTTVGGILTDWVNDGVFGTDGWNLFGNPNLHVGSLPPLVDAGLDAINCAPWLHSLIVNGIIAGVGAVLGFVPQILVLFACLAFLESCGYMARVAFIMDRIFRKFGLSGKSFIPILIGTGCGVPGIMSSRTIENDRDRKMTIMTTTFIPCSAKLPIIALIAGAFFGNAWWVAPSAYFIGGAAIVCSGILLKKFRAFAGEPAPFVMELPSYHMPTAGTILRSMWERGFSFIKKAGTVILLATILIWALSSFGVVNGTWQMLDSVDMENSILAMIGHRIAIIFRPLGWGNWKFAVAAITGLMAKENVVGTFGILFGHMDSVAEDGTEVWAAVRTAVVPLAAYSYMVFNLLCAPCFAAMGAIRREMNNPKWFLAAIGYQCLLAYGVALCIYQIGMLTQGVFGVGTVVAFAIVALFIYLLVRPYKDVDDMGVSNLSIDAN